MNFQKQANEELKKFATFRYFHKKISNENELLLFNGKFSIYFYYCLINTNYNI